MKQTLSIMPRYERLDSLFLEGKSDLESFSALLRFLSFKQLKGLADTGMYQSGFRGEVKQLSVEEWRVAKLMLVSVRELCFGGPVSMSGRSTRLGIRKHAYKRA